MTNYYAKRDARVRLSEVLELNGWQIFGFKNDESDSMTDYYSPANWEGIATKNGYTLVVDKKYNGDSGRVVTKRSNKISSLNYSKINKLEKMTIENGCTESEAQNAKNQIAKLKEKLQNNKNETVLYTYPEFMVNPKGCIWHLEKEGEILCKGRSLTVFADLVESYRFDYELEEFKPGYDYYYGFDENNNRVQEKRELNKYELKALNEVKKLISKLESFVSIKIGDSEEEQGLVKVVDYKTVTKLEKQEVVRSSELNINDVVWCSGSYCKVTKIDSEHNCYHAVKISGKTFKESKAMGANFRLNKKSFDRGISSNTLKIYVIAEVEEKQEVVKWVKKKTKKTTKTATKKPEVKNNTEELENIVKNEIEYSNKVLKEEINKDSEIEFTKQYPNFKVDNVKGFKINSIDYINIGYVKNEFNEYELNFLDNGIKWKDSFKTYDSMIEFLNSNKDQIITLRNSKEFLQTIEKLNYKKEFNEFLELKTLFNELVNEPIEAFLNPILLDSNVYVLDMPKLMFKTGYTDHIDNHSILDLSFKEYLFNKGKRQLIDIIDYLLNC